MWMVVASIARIEHSLRKETRMAGKIQRREFLTKSFQTGLSALPLIACSRQDRSAGVEPTSVELLIAELEKELPALMADARLPGLSVALIKDAKLFWRRGFGFKDAAAKQPVDNDTMFEAASMSKPVFAYAVMKLCEKGTMDLDTSLTKFTTERFLENDPRLEH